MKYLTVVMKISIIKIWSLDKFNPPLFSRRLSIADSEEEDLLITEVKHSTTVKIMIANAC